MWQVETKRRSVSFFSIHFGGCRWEGQSWVSHVLQVYSCMYPARRNDNPQNICKISTKLYPAWLQTHISIWSFPLLSFIEMGNFLQDIKHYNLNSLGSCKMREIAPRHSFIPKPNDIFILPQENGLYCSHNPFIWRPSRDQCSQGCTVVTKYNNIISCKYMWKNIQPNVNCKRLQLCNDCTTIIRIDHGYLFWSKPLPKEFQCTSHCHLWQLHQFPLCHPAQSKHQ